MKKNLSLKIGSLLFAIGMWFYIIQVQSPDVEKTIKDVPVFFTQQADLENRKLMLLNDKEYTVDLKLRGQRKLLIDLEKSDISVSVDVGRIESTGVHSLNASVAVPYGNVEIIRQSPAMITVTVDEIVEEEKETIVKTVGEPLEGYSVGKAKTTPETVTLRGAKSIVGGVEYVSVTVDVSGKSEDISTVEGIELVSTSNTVIDSSYVTVSHETLDVHCEILKKKIVSVVPRFAADVNGEGSWYTLDDNSVKTIEVAGAASVLEKLDSVYTQWITKEMIREDGVVEVGLELPVGLESLDGERLTLKLKHIG